MSGDHEHQAVLSEPGLYLHCAECGEWLRGVNDGFEVVSREDADRGIHWCPQCESEWVGNDDYCKECEAPVWSMEERP